MTMKSRSDQSVMNIKIPAEEKSRQEVRQFNKTVKDTVKDIDKQIKTEKGFIKKLTAKQKRSKGRKSTKHELNESIRNHKARVQRLKTKREKVMRPIKNIL